ncbi:MAG: chromosome segregation protein SMC [Archaeoglobus sp.]|nr:chromosome segregation protein SMC [Archaeoglobus sp.]
MHIKKIIIKNFKSFNKRVEIPLFKGFTVISGPNGSGKSNIVDAILFCLGLTPSTRLLRADRLTDLIHTGNGNLTEAEVSVVFDNSDGELKGDKEIKITRRIKRTEKGYYSYNYINGKASSLSEIQKLLSAAGIHSDAYNVVMQGDVTRIAEMTPFQRRKIIDDISGISEFDEKKEKALEELEVVRENIERINTILIEVNRQLEQLEADRQEALRYKGLLEEKEKYNRYLKINRYLNLISRKKRIEYEISRLEREKDRILQDEIELNAKISELNSKADEISAKIYELADENYKSIQEEIVELTSRREALKKSRDIRSQEIQELENERTKLLVAISKLKEELNDIEDEIQKFSIQKVSVQEILDDLEARKSMIELKLSQIGEAHSNLKDELLSKREVLESLKETRSEKVNERDRALEVIRRIGMELEDLERERDTASQEIESIVKEISEISKERERIERELEREIKKRNEIDSRIFSIRNQLSSVEEEIKSLEVELSKIKAQLSVLESAFSKAVELILEARKRKALPGVYGTVSQLCEVSEEFVIALEIAASNALQWIVVENEDDAVRCIKYLKQIDGGRATFIPMNKIKKNFGKLELDKSVLRERGVIDYAVNLIKCEKKFRAVFNFIYRDTLVVENIDVAKRLMDGRRIVTLDGDLIERSGTLTGGSLDRKRGILATKELFEKQNRINEEITILKSKKTKIMGDLRSAEEEKRILQSKIDTINQDYQELNNKISVLESKLDATKARLSEIERKIEEKLKEREEIYKGITAAEEKISEIENKIRELEDEISSLEKKLRGSEIPKLTEELERLKDDISRNREALVIVEKNLENAEFRKQQSLAFIHEKEMQIKGVEERKKEIRERIAEEEREYEEIGKRLEKLREEEKKVGESVKGLREERNRLLSEIRELESKRDEKRFETKSIEERIKARNEALEALKDEIEQNKVEYDEKEKIPPHDEIITKLNEIEDELSKFGDVNLKAIQDYEEVKARKDELMEKKLVLEKEREGILERIERYEGMKRDAFFEAFNAINTNFKEIISRLTEGEGELYLDSLDDPFNSGLHIKLKIRDRPTQKIESMSGGEKSLVALSLIFAIQKYRPAPFYAFDEIDMFLDGINVEKVASLINERSKEAQFIVVSLRKPTLEKADSIIGVTLSKDNSSTVTGIKLKT